MSGHHIVGYPEVIFGPGRQVPVSRISGSLRITPSTNAIAARTSAHPKTRYVSRAGQPPRPLGFACALRCPEDFGNLRWIDRRGHFAVDDLHFRPVEWFVMAVISASTILPL